MRFDYVAYDEKAKTDQSEFKELFQDLEKLTTERLKPGRATSLILTKLEEAYMWAGKAIRDEQIVRNGSASAQEERSNS